jgi:hypothetical protein
VRKRRLITQKFASQVENRIGPSAQFLALAQLKKFKKALLGKETPPDEEEDLDEDSSDAEIKKKLRARVANERAYSALTLTCGEAKSF